MDRKLMAAALALAAMVPSSFDPISGGSRSTTSQAVRPKGYKLGKKQKKAARKARQKARHT